MEFSPRQHCATCVHIAHVTSPRRTFFRCQRLGWETEPRYQFSCWVERPRHDKMPRLVEPDPDIGGSSPA
jgi:hypothetical protein